MCAPVASADCLAVQALIHYFLFLNRRTKSNTLVAVCCGNTSSRRICRIEFRIVLLLCGRMNHNPRGRKRTPFCYNNDCPKFFSSSTASSLTRSGDGTKQKRKVFGSVSQSCLHKSIASINNDPKFYSMHRTGSEMLKVRYFYYMIPNSHLSLFVTSFCILLLQIVLHLGTTG